jgi:hypothetical protein
MGTKRSKRDARGGAGGGQGRKRHPLKAQGAVAVAGTIAETAKPFVAAAIGAPVEAIRNRQIDSVLLIVVQFLVRAQKSVGLPYANLRHGTARV